MQKITDSIYVETGYAGANVGCIVTEEGAVLVDSPFVPKDALHWRAQVDRVARNKGIAYVVNTHSHFDHMLCNSLLCSKAIVHQQALERFHSYLDKDTLNTEINMFFPEELQQFGDEIAKVDIVLPQITFDGRLDLHLGSQTIQLLPCGGHLSGSILIYLADEKVLFCGDNVDNHKHPGMSAANFQEWLKLLRDIEGMDVQHIVPGHGEVGDKTLATEMRKYFEEMIKEVKRYKEAQVETTVIVERVKQHMLDYWPVEDKKELKWQKRVLEVGINRLCQ